MPTHRVKLIEASQPQAFESALQMHLFDLTDSPFINPDTVRVSLSTIPGTYYAALVTWVDYESDEEAKYQREQARKAHEQLPASPAAEL
jgi:hypothetical protein